MDYEKGWKDLKQAIDFAEEVFNNSPLCPESESKAFGLALARNFMKIIEEANKQEYNKELTLLDGKSEFIDYKKKINKTINIKDYVRKIFN